MYKIEYASFQELLTSLQKSGYTTIAPTIRDGNIVYDEVHRTADLPVGWTDEQGPGRYTLKRRSDEAIFGYNASPHSWKKFLFPPSVNLMTLIKKGRSFSAQHAQSQKSHKGGEKLAFIGVRSCELNAIEIQDKIFLHGNFVDEHYRSLREKAFIVAVNCTSAGGTCFCASMNAGPECKSGYDLALTEIVNNDSHCFLVAVGSSRGEQVMQSVAHAVPGKQEAELANNVLERAARSMGRSVDVSDIKALLQDNPEHPRWDTVARRCLTCTNCTMVCPTCFCVTIEETGDLAGKRTERLRKWDSCFTMEFSYIHGGPVRSSVMARYRQWLTHKFASWHDQFGRSGCVGCGRCITWCPVGIDVTEEIQAIQQAKKQIKTHR